MPSIIEEDSWDQNDGHVFVSLPLRNVHKKLVDVFTTPKYIKVSYPPYLFECYLFAEIDEEASSAEIAVSQITLKLRKALPVPWSCLHHAHHKDKALLREVRNEAVEYAIKRSSILAQQKSLSKRENHGFAVGEHISTESTRKAQAKLKQEDEKQAFFRNTVDTDHFLLPNSAAECQENNTVCSSDSSVSDPVTPCSEGSFEELLQSIAQIGEKKSSKRTPSVQPAKMPAAIRNRGNISFDATPRQFPTPKRESKTAEEEEWLAKQTSYKHLLKDQGVDLAAEERDPVLLKRKGDGFATVEDYDSAVSCYSLAVTMDCKMPEIFLNRGLCHLHKRNFHKVLEDMSSALENLSPPVESNRKERGVAHWRRGIAFCELEVFVEGLVELQAAQKLLPTNDLLDNQVQSVKRVITSGEPEEPPHLSHQSLLVPEVSYLL